MNSQVVAPGDVVAVLPEQGKVKVGAGLYAEGNSLHTSKAGVLRQTKVGKLWVEGRQKRYIPSTGDDVVGIVLERHAENFVVDIGAPFPAVLNFLAFEGATRRNRPKLSEGDLVYARVVLAHRDTDTEVSCTDSGGKASGYGPLKGGCLMTCTTALARRLLASPPAPVLDALGKSVQFEIAIGQNGRVWIDAASAATVVLIANAIARSEFLSADQSRLLVQKLMARVASQVAAQ
ncbi:Exosome complex component rrp40 [Coccomyxa sp. Obi]|nr:Exosome complex component rrp40 [Coccomyxa sp. Obi]